MVSMRSASTLLIGILTSTHVGLLDRLNLLLTNRGILASNGRSKHKTSPRIVTLQGRLSINLEVRSRSVSNFELDRRLSNPVALTNVRSTFASRASTVHFELQLSAIPNEVLERASFITISLGSIVLAIRLIPDHTDVVFTGQTNNVITLRTFGSRTDDSYSHRLLIVMRRSVMLAGRSISESNAGHGQSQNDSNDNRQKLFHVEFPLFLVDCGDIVSKMLAIFSVSYTKNGS